MFKRVAIGIEALGLKAVSYVETEAGYGVLGKGACFRRCRLLCGCQHGSFQ